MLTTACMASSIFAYCSENSSEDAKLCSDCHATASVCTKKTGYVICTCIAGYIGNGVNCTAISSCGTQNCCPSGYYWDNRISFKVCTDINECNDNTLNKCVPSSTCKNMNGFYLCISNRSTNCTTSPCPYDQDCLSVAGNVQCADPCFYYQTLNGTSRLSTIDSTGVFSTDRYNIGWFRFTGSAGLRMQEECAGTLKCGSLTPFSLNGTHPTIGEGIKIVPLQINSLSGCLTGANITIKACPDNFYIYKFSGMLQSDVYCTDPQFTASSIIPTMVTTKAQTTTTTTTTTTQPTTILTTTPATTTTTTLTTAIPTAVTTTSPTTISPTTTLAMSTKIIPTSTTVPTTITTYAATSTSPNTTAQISASISPTPSPIPEKNITVTSVKSINIVSVTTSTKLENDIEVSSLEINKTTAILIEVQTITASTIRTKTSNSISYSSLLIMVGDGEPVTLTDTPSLQITDNETVSDNLENFQFSLYNGKPIEIHTLTDTFSVPGDGFTTTTTVTTTSTEEVIVVGPPLLPSPSSNTVSFSATGSATNVPKV
ncbi:cell wall DAN4-like [Pelobates cultripes]|uniref:Cell wall DAN4-like n=1 Tax=Pelobates cultripes TaxID=61616 RepID=A0AAD1VN86_PELCU|nr:cell wall DAN4-like [Pelobates cultripes]